MKAFYRQEGQDDEVTPGQRGLPVARSLSFRDGRDLLGRWPHLCWPGNSRLTSLEIPFLGEAETVMKLSTESWFDDRWWQVTPFWMGCLPCRRHKRCEFDPWVRGGNSNSLQYSCLEKKFCGQRSLVGYRPWVCKELDTTEQVTLCWTCFSFLIGQGLRLAEVNQPSDLQRKIKERMLHSLINFPLKVKYTEDCGPQYKTSGNQCYLSLFFKCHSTWNTVLPGKNGSRSSVFIAPTALAKYLRTHFKNA